MLNLMIIKLTVVHTGQIFQKAGQKEKGPGYLSGKKSWTKKRRRVSS